MWMFACTKTSEPTERATAVIPPSEQAATKPAAAPKPDSKPTTDTMTATNSNQYTVELDTTKGPIVIDIHPAWAPLGAKRFRELVEAGYFTDVAFFRVIGGFMAQVGLHGDPATTAEWRGKRIADDPVKESNTRGMVTFATSGPNSRTTQFFINFGDNSRLDGMGFAPFGKVRDMTPVDALYSEYGEGGPRGRGPSQAQIQSRGNEYLRADFPKLDYIKSAKILKE